MKKETNTTFIVYLSENGYFTDNDRKTIQVSCKDSYSDIIKKLLKGTLLSKENIKE